jgi:flagellin-like hook-associated protein FlgL
MNKIKTSIKLLTLALTTAILTTSCGGGSNDKNFDKNVELKAHDTKIKGYLADVFEVVDGSYKFDYKGSQYTGEGKIQVKIKSIGSGDINDYGLQDGNSGPLYLTICDKNGAPLTDFSDIASEYTGDDLLKDMMKKKGEENWIAFHAYTYQGKALPDDAATFIITSKKTEKSEESASTSDDDTEVSSSGNENYDKVLDDYEAYVDKYLVFLKKANKGDMSAMEEYPALMEKAQDLEKSLKDAENQKSLSASQMKRMVKIQTKMLNAAIDMQK